MKLDPTRAAAVMARTSFRACASFALIHLLANPAAAQSIAGASVSAGSATVSGVGSTNVTIAQTSDKAVIDWRAFSVDSGTTVTFRQPGAASIALNRISGSGTTRIDGSLVANGQVWLLNPNGVLIGAGGSVAAGGFLASTHAISNADFMAGNYQLTGDGSGAGVTNLGSIVAADGGYAVLAGNHVANAGLVQARLGTVALGAGKTFVLDVVGDKLLSFAVSEPLSIVASSGPLVDNRGVLAAQGGQVLLTARAAAGVVGSVINTSGLIDATAVSSQGGTIVLDGGTAGEVDATGLLTVSGLGAGQTGGTIQAFGQTVVAGDYAALDARGSAGGGSIYLGGGWQGASIGGYASAVRAGVASTAVLDASAVDTGNGGTVELWSDVTNPYSQTLAYGGFYARGGANGGDGGRIETSGHYLDTTGVTGSAAAMLGKAGTWLFDPYDVEIVAAGSVGSGGATTNYFANGLGDWQLYNNNPSASLNVVTSYTAGSNSYTSPIGGNFVVMDSGNVSNASYVDTYLYKTFTAGTPTTVDFYTLNIANPVNLGLYTGVSDYNGQSSTTYNTPTGVWQHNSITFAAGDQYNVYEEIFNYMSGTGQVGSAQLALAVGSGGGPAPNGAFSASNFGQTWTPTGSASKIDVSQITGFLNTGTNVQVTTTGAGTDVGNITVSAAIAKSAGTAATLQLDATNAIIVNQAIGSSANALNVTLNAGAGGIQLNNTVSTNGGTLTLNTSGASTQTAAGTLTTNALVLAGIGGNHTLTNAGNGFATLSGTTGAANLADSVAVGINGLSTTGALTLASTGAISLAGTDIFGGATTLKSPGTITLISGAQIAASGALALEADTNFVNQAGANAIATTGAGRWLIYSQGPANDNFGGLVSGNTAVWGATVASTPPGSAPAGNRYLFALSPTITVTPGAARKTYGDLLTSADISYAYSGLVQASNYQNVFNQDVLTGSPGTDQNGFARTQYTGTYTFAANRGSLATTSGYAFAFGSATLTVDPRALILTALTDSRVYDRTAASSLTPTASGLVNGDTISNLSQAFDSANAGNRLLSATNSYVISTTSGQTGSFNYTITKQTAAGTITPKALTAALTGGTAKIYDGTTTAALPPSDYQLSGVILGDTVALNNPANGSYADKNVGTGKTVTVTGLALTGASANNYTVNASASAAIGSITAKTLSASLTGSVAKTYDGSTTATLANGNYVLTGAVVGDAVALNDPTTGTYDTKNAGTAKTVAVTGLALTGADAGNYTVNAGTSAAIGGIAAKVLAASLTGSVTKTYDGSTAAALADANYVLTGAVVGDAVALNDPTTGTYDTKNAGTAKTVAVTGLALTGADAGNYTVNAGTSAAIGSVAAKTLNASLTGSVAKTYDGTTTAATLANANYVLTGTVLGDAVALNDPTAGTYDTKNVGTAKTVAVTGLALTGADAGNYTVNANTSAAIGSIAAKALGASLTGSVAKTYDGSTTATLANGNYVLTGAVAGDAVVLNDPTTGTYDTKNAGTAKTVGVTGLALTGADAGNYTVNTDTSAAIGNVTAKALGASLTGSVSKVYDGSTAAALANGNYVLTGAVAGDAVVLNDPTTGTYDTKNAGTAKTVAVTGLALTGADAGNYTVNAGTSAAIGSIAVKALAASLTGSVAKTYDGSTAATLANGNYVLTGAVAGDAVALNDPITGTYDTKNAGTGKAVAVTGLALTGADAGNYTVNTATDATIGTVAAKALAVGLVGTVAKTANGGTDAALAPDNFLLAGFVPGEGASVGKTGGYYANASAGTGIVVTTTLAAGDFAPTAGTALGNYVLPVGKVSGAIGTINPSIVIVTPTPVAPPAAVVAAIAATAVLPATSVPVPVTPAADSASAATVAVAAATVTVAINVDRSPPSPVAAQKPPTPVDSADAGDPILATVSEPPSEKPASHATRQTTVTVPIAGGLLAQQQTVPSRGTTVPGVDQAFSGGGGVF